MARKNVLKEVKGFKAASKTTKQIKTDKQVQIIKSPNPLTIQELEKWEAWECRGDSDNPANWYQTWEGELEECWEFIEETINCYIDEVLNEDGTLFELLEQYDDDDEEQARVLQSLYAPQIVKIRRDCAKKGGFRGSNWALTLASQSTKFRPQEAGEGIFTYSDEWTGWEQIADDPDNPKSWRCIIDGLLPDCIEAMTFFIRLEIDRATDHQFDDMDIDSFSKYQEGLCSNLAQEVERQCLIKGEYRGRGWAIFSIKSGEKCWWLSRHPSLENYPYSN